MATCDERLEQEFLESLTKYSNQLAPEGKVYQCMACGKKSRDMYGYKKISSGWDESCMLNCALVDEA